MRVHSSTCNNIAIATNVGLSELGIGEYRRGVGAKEADIDTVATCVFNKVSRMHVLSIILRSELT
jgi:poly(A) polymerase Pap1